MHFYNNIRNNIYHFNIDKWLQTTEGGTGRNVLKQPGTRKLCFLESNTGQKAVSPGSLKHITWLRGTAKNPDKKKKLNRRRVRKRNQNFSLGPH